MVLRRWFSIHHPSVSRWGYTVHAMQVQLGEHTTSPQLLQGSQDQGKWIAESDGLFIQGLKPSFLAIKKKLEEDRIR